jgi:hypothetical protein
MNTAEIRELIKQELPRMVREDVEIQDLILRLSRQEFAPRQQTEDRFDRLMARLDRDQEIQNKRWEENQAELRRMREESERKFGASERKWETLREESERKFEEHRREFVRVHEEIMALSRKQECGIGALGARWGLSSEKAFRDGLAAVLEKSFDVRVLNVTEYDDQGAVFGRPDQVELDVIVINGTLILMELKSSIDKAGMYIFERKARFYEQRHNRKANRLIVISPMIDAKARQVGERLGIEMFGDSGLVESL